jgi:hypothetical protein
MIKDSADWTTLVESASGLMPATPEGKRAWKTLKAQLAPDDVEQLAALAASGSGQERLAALWLLSFETGSSLLTEAARPLYIRNVATALHRAELMSHQWYHARNCLFDLEIEPNPVDEDLRLRGLTQEQYLQLEEEQRKAELARRLPPVVDVATAVQTLVDAHPVPPAPADLAERLRVAAEAWRQRADHTGLNAVFLYVVNLPPATVSYRGVVDLLASPSQFDNGSAYYGDKWSGLVIIANSQGTIDAVKIN